MSLDPHQQAIVRIKDACRMIGIGRSKLYALIASGRYQSRRPAILPQTVLDQYSSQKLYFSNVYFTTSTSLPFCCTCEFSLALM